MLCLTEMSTEVTCSLVYAPIFFSGDYERCCLELEECMRVMEQHYGPESIELAHEFLKYSEVLQLAGVTNPR